MTEIWRETFCPGYEVSSLGRVRGPKGMLRPCPNGNGYLRVSLRPGGKLQSTPVHTLVCEAFYGPKPFPTAQARHKDGNKLNNRADNLCWGTPKENQADRVTHGTDSRGIRQGAAKLTESNVVTIRERYATGAYTQAQLGEEFGVSQVQISKIVRGAKWAWL